MTENTGASNDFKRPFSDSEAPEGKKIKEKSPTREIYNSLRDNKSQTDKEVFIPLNDQEKGLTGEEMSNPLNDEERSPAGQEVIVPDEEEEFAQIQEYYFEALENLATDPSRAIDFMQVTINEADRLLRKHYETNPQLFDGEFYLVLGSSLFYLSQITNRGPEEEEAFIDEAISRLKSALDLCATERINETQLALCKALYHKAGLMMQSASQAPESENQSILDSALTIMNDAGVYMKAIFAKIFEGKVSDSGKFFDLTQESIDVLGHAQLLADSETTWSSFKNKNDWCQDLYRMALDCKDASVQVNANLGVAACYISSSNYYFDNAPQDDSDSDSDGEDANQACLVAEMNPSVVKDQLTRACEHISAAIDSLGNSSVETKARAYQMQGEAYLNLGNLSSDEAEELKCYRIAVKAFQIAKELQPHGLLPDSFESFLEEWAYNIE